MKKAQLAPLKYDSTVFARTTTMAECTGVYKGLMEEEQSVWLTDVKWYSAPAANIGPRNYDSLMLPLKNIVHIEGVQSAPAEVAVASSLVAISDTSTADRPAAAINYAAKNVFNCFTARNLPFQANMTTTTNTNAQMQDFCKQLFGNCNFAHLLQIQANTHEKKFCIRLPSYLANFFRQPSLSFKETKSQGVTADDGDATGDAEKSLAIMKPVCKMSFDQQLIAASTGGAGEPNLVDKTAMDVILCSEFSNLNLNECFYRLAEPLLDAIEVDMSNFEATGSFAQFKIGNSCLETCSQMNNDSAVNEHSTDEQANMDYLMDI